MENQEKAQRLSEMAEGHDEEKNPRAALELEDFDNIAVDKKVQGELVVKNNKYLSKEDEAIDLASINVREASSSILIFRNIPFAIWFFGFLILLSGLYLIYHLAFGHFGVLFNGYREGHWWQYVISVMLVLFGIFFMFAGKVESVIFDK